MDCIQTELPSVQWLIRVNFSADSVMVVALNQSASTIWLGQYAGQRGITYPFVFDGTGTVFKAYEIGAGYGNIPPTFVILDQQGVVRYRIDDKFNRVMEMTDFIRNLLKGGGK